MKNETIQTPSGPQVFRVYDSGPDKGADRYTVYYMDRAAWGITPEAIARTGRDVYPFYGMNALPFHPSCGIAQHGEGKLGKHNGKRIPFASLPLDCQRAVMQDFPAKLYECGICSCLHPWDWNGDCRDDANRYADAEDYGARNNIEKSLWANGIEVVPMEDRLAADAGEDAPEVSAPVAKTETVLYGIPKGETERYTEVLLLTNATPEKIERVKALATRDGFHSFRVAVIDLSTPPDFAGTVRK